MQKKKIILTTLLALLAVFGAAAHSARAMTISPPDFNLTVNPGDVIKDVLHLYNEDPYAITLRPKLLNFTFRPGDETSGSPDFYPADEIKNGHELASWVMLEDDRAFTIASGQSLNIPFTITVPKDAEPGGHFGAIHVGTLQETAVPGSPQIGVMAAASALVFVRVNGDIRDDLSVESFFASKAAYAHLPADFTLRLANNGTTHVIPVGNIFITDMFGRQAASLEVNGEDLRRILPGSIRRFDESWMRKRLPKSASEFVQQWRNFAIGRYTATLVVNYGDAGQQKLLSAATTFWVFPWMAILSLLLALSLIFLVARLLAKRYERNVISRYESRKRQGKA